ncbi:RagB/SusD family nutrient uptake outer membrane protein [Mucilaginibacter arboris]|nr:RagB/SusD family nutrient uptake outer membrane protein [Mucilaginibacter arboris]
MKKILLSLLLIGSCVNFSCKKALLEEPAYTLNEQTLFTDAASAQLALNACYGYLASQGVYGQALIMVSEMGSGIGWMKKTGDELSSLNIIASGGGGFVAMLWNGLYQTIGQCNIFIAAADKSSLSNKTNLIAQAKFIRALCYYNLVFIYGGVPLKITPATPETTDVPRSTKQQVIDQIVADLVAAGADLNSTEPDSSVPSKIAANAMLAKVYFLLASSEGQGSSNWQLAKQYGTKVFTAWGGTVPLESSYAGLFDINNRTSKESIFKLNYSALGLNSAFNKGSWSFSPVNSTLKGINFDNKGSSRAFYSYFKKMHPGDPRLDATFFHISYTNVLTGALLTVYPTVTTYVQNAYPFYKKYYDPNQTGQISNKTLYVYRYADFLLLMADVENELGNTATAVNYVNIVLTRARNSVTPAASQPANVAASIAQADLRQVIFDERLFELSEEGHSFMEARRRGITWLKQITTRNNAQADAIAGFSTANNWTEYSLPVTDEGLTKAMLMPIPPAELNTNKAFHSTDQNPGY